MLPRRIASAVWWVARPTLTPSQVTRFTITLPADQQFADDTRSMMAISRDGSRLAYFANGRLHAQTMSTGESHPIVGSEIAAGVANNLSISPDGRWIAYWDSSDRHLKKISISGGSPVMLASTFNPVGVSWDHSGILLADPMSGELVRLGADCGKREVLVRAKEDEILWSPQMLPDREHVLFSVGDRTAGRSASPDVVVQSVRSGERHVVIRGGTRTLREHRPHSLFLRWRIVWRAIRRTTSRNGWRANSADRRRHRGIPSFRRVRQWVAHLHCWRQSNRRARDDRATWQRDVLASKGCGVRSSAHLA